MVEATHAVGLAVVIAVIFGVILRWKVRNDDLEITEPGEKDRVRHDQRQVEGRVTALELRADVIRRQERGD